MELMRLYKCGDCKHQDLLGDMRRRDHGGWDCPKCGGEIKKKTKDLRELEQENAELRELIGDCLGEIKTNYDYDFGEYKMLEERFKKLKEQGE